MTPPLTAIAVDDEPKALEIISIHCAKIPFLQLQHTFRDALEAISWLRSNQVDLVFLDINMPNLSGLAFRSLIGDQPMIIFTTAYAEYAVESYELKAIDYLLKPIPFARFLDASLKAQEQHQWKKDKPLPPTPPPSQTIENIQTIYVKSGTKLYKLNIAEILYIEKDGNYVFFHTLNGRLISRLNMQQLMDLLPENHFLRVHKSFVIALRHIDVFEPHQVTIGNKKIPVSKTQRELLIQAIQHF